MTTLLSGEWGEEGGGAATPQSEPSPDLVGVAVSLTMPSVITRSHLSLGLQVRHGLSKGIDMCKFRF